MNFEQARKVAFDLAHFQFSLNSPNTIKTSKSNIKLTDEMWTSLMLEAISSFYDGVEGNTPVRLAVKSDDIIKIFGVDVIDTIRSIIVHADGNRPIGDELEQSFQQIQQGQGEAKGFIGAEGLAGLISNTADSQAYGQASTVIMNVESAAPNQGLYHQSAQQLQTIAKTPGLSQPFAMAVSSLGAEYMQLADQLTRQSGEGQQPSTGTGISGLPTGVRIGRRAIVARQNIIQYYIKFANTLIDLSNKFDKFASTNSDLFKDYVVDKIIGFYRRADKKFPQTQQALQSNDYLNSLFDEATGYALKELGNDTDRILSELPELSRQYILKDIENNVRELWANRKQEGAREGLEFFKSVYDFLTSNDTVSNWDRIYENYNPGWRNDYKENWEQELDVGEQYQPSLGEIFQEMNVPEEEPSPEDLPEAVSIEDYEDYKPPKPREDVVQPPAAAEEPRRPIEEVLEQKIKILDPNTREKTFEVGVGDEVFNQSARQIFQQIKDEYGLTKNEINKYSVGRIKEIRDDGSLLVEVPDAKDPFDEQIWDVNSDKLWGSREEGQRVVNQ